MMSIFGKVGRAVGLGGAAKVGQAMGLPMGGGGGGMSALTSNPQAMAAMQAAKSQFRGQGPLRGMAGMLKAGRAAMNQPQQPGPPAQMAGPAGLGVAGAAAAMAGRMGALPQKAPGGATAGDLSSAMQNMGVPDLSQPQPTRPGPSILQAGIQQAIGGNPQETDPYEAWKAGGRQGARPAGY